MVNLTLSISYGKQSIIPIANFLIIFCGNIALGIKLTKRRKMKDKRDNTRTVSRDAQAISMLFAGVICYSITQFPAFVYNTLIVAARSPFCAFELTDNVRAVLEHTTAALVNVNYSINFLLYFGISKEFRQAIRDDFGGCICTKSDKKSEGLIVYAGNRRQTLTTSV